jgi:hypothetical protein
MLEATIRTDRDNIKKKAEQGTEQGAEEQGFLKNHHCPKK